MGQTNQTGNAATLDAKFCNTKFRKIFTLFGRNFVLLNFEDRLRHRYSFFFVCAAASS
jgi:hypothetical protein